MAEFYSIVFVCMFVYMHIYSIVYIYMYINMCVCVCVCVLYPLPIDGHFGYFNILAIVHNIAVNMSEG